MVSRRSSSSAARRLGGELHHAAQPIRVLVADGQRVIRDGLSALLGMLPEVEVVGTAIDGDDAVQQAQVLAPDVVLLGLYLPIMMGWRPPAGSRRGSRVPVSSS